MASCYPLNCKVCEKNARGCFCFLDELTSIPDRWCLLPKENFTYGCTIHTLSLHIPPAQSQEMFIHAITRTPLRWITCLHLLFVFVTFHTIPGRLPQQQL